MFIANPHVSGFSGPEWSRHKGLVERFEEAWLRGDRPAIDEYLPAEAPARRAVLLELIHTDLEFRLKAGEVIGIENYQDRYPELRDDRPALLDLISAEYLMHCRSLPGPDPDEYLRRFPDLRTELAPRLQTAERPGAPSAAALAPPRHLGRYEILEPLGSGTGGRVFKARDTELDRVVALKLPRLGAWATADEVARFLREARSAAQLRHPGIVPVHDVGAVDGLCYLVSEFIPGTTLAQRLTAGRFDFRAAAELVAQVAEALEHAHRQGVIHRDVKPSNILLDPEGRPHLTDFGLARRAAGEASLTAEGDLLGTPAYMAPEQARGEAHRVDARGDLYSLGVVLYHLLTGDLPFHGTAPMVLRQVLDEEPCPPRRLDDRIPRDLETICLKAMAKEPAGRYAAAGDLAADLGRFLRGESVQARPVGRLTRLLRWCRRQPAAAGLVAALALGLAGTGWQWRRAEVNLTDADRQRVQAELNLAEADRQRVQAEYHFQRGWRAVADFARLDLGDLYAGRQGLLPLHRELADRALLFYQKVLKNYEPFLDRLDDEPGLLLDVARVYLQVARLYTYFAPGQKDQALAAWRQNLSLWEKMLHHDPAAVEYWMGRVESAYELGRLTADPRQQEAALQVLGQTRAFLLDRTAKKATPDTLVHLQSTYHWAGLLQHDRGRPAEALAAHRQGLILAQRLVQAVPTDLGYQSTLARNFYHLARAQADTGHPAEAIDAYQDSAALWQRQAAAYPSAGHVRRDLAACYHNLGNLARDADQPGAAVCFYQMALILREELSREHSGESRYAQDRDGTRRNLTQVLQGFQTAVK